MGRYTAHYMPLFAFIVKQTQLGFVHKCCWGFMGFAVLTLKTIIIFLISISPLHIFISIS